VIKTVGRGSATLSQDRTILAAQFGWRSIFLPGNALGLADSDHELGLLAGQFASARTAASSTDFGKIFAHFCR
jgi:hypothetical protein